MVVWNLPTDWNPCIALLAHHRHARLAWRRAPLLRGVRFAKGRRTVARWWRAAGIRRGFPGYYYFPGRRGRRTEALAGSLRRRAREQLGVGARLLFARDDTPPPRYGPKVQGAGIHHHPTPGPTHPKCLDGHLWVTRAGIVRHPRWGVLGRPLWALLYVRPKDLATIPERYGWSFATKLELAVRLVPWLVGGTRFVGKALGVVVDGGYAQAPFLKPALAAGVVLVGRLRQDAARRDGPPPRRPDPRRGPGRPRTCGAHRVSWAKRAGPQRGWQTITAVRYGERVQQSSKTFLATWPSVGGVRRVVLVPEEDGWLPFCCPDVNASAAAILEAVAARSAIAQDCHALKEGEGLGQQQVRTIGANVAVSPLNLGAPTLVEWWAWSQPKREVCDRTASPWDEAARRPSHADQRKALPRQSLEEAFVRIEHGQRLTQKFQRLLRGLIRLVS